MRRGSVFINICLMLLIPAFAGAEINPWTHTVYFENDLFNGTDSNYTNGVKYSIISPDLSPHAPDGKLPRKVLEYIHRIPFIGGTGPEFTHKVEFSLGQSMFTPADISRRDLIEDDRPYAGWLYVSTSYHRRNRLNDNLNLMDTVELQFGIVGPASLTEESQKLVHRLRDLQRPEGWDNQLNNEPGIAAVYERKWLIQPFSKMKTAFNTIAHAGAAIGNVYTYLNGGLELRAGWNVPEDFGVSLIRPAGSTRLEIDRTLRIYGFGAVNGRAVARDIFLDGNTFTDSHSVDKEPLVADLAAGAAVSFRNVMLTWTQVLRTKEFRGQRGSHSFGAVALSFSVPFDLRRLTDIL